MAKNGCFKIILIGIILGFLWENGETAMEPVKNYVSYEVIDSTAIFTCESGSLGTHKVRLRFCQPNMVEVTFTIRGDLSYSLFNNYRVLLKQNWTPVSITDFDEGDYIKLQTDELTVRVYKSPFRIEFYKADNTTYISGDCSIADENGVYGMGCDNNTYRIRKNKTSNEHFFGWGDNYGMGSSKDPAGDNTYTFDRTGKIVTGGYPTLHQHVGDYDGYGMISSFFYSTDGYGIFIHHSPDSSNDKWDPSSDNCPGITYCGGCNFSEFDMGYTSPNYYKITFTHRAGYNRDQMVYYFIYGPSYAKVIDSYTEAIGVPEIYDNGKPPLLTKWVYGVLIGAAAFETVHLLENHVIEMRNQKLPFDLIIGDVHYCWVYANSEGYAFFPEDPTDPLYEGAINHSPNEIMNWLDSYGVKLGFNGSIHGNTNGGGGRNFFDTDGPNNNPWEAAQFYVDHGVDVQWSDYDGDSRRHEYFREDFNAFKQAFNGDESQIFMINGWNTFCTHAFPTSWPGDVIGSAKCALAGSMCGYPFLTYDVRLYDPAYTVIEASVLPIWRFHCYYTGMPHEILSETNKTLYREWAGFHYKLIPYLFTYGGIASETGAPIMRHMVWEDPQNPATYNKADWNPYFQYYLGDLLLAAPYNTKYDSGYLKPVWIPEGIWYNWFTGEKYEGEQTINVDVSGYKLPLYVKAGAIIPLAPEMQYVGEKPEDPITLKIWPLPSGGVTSFELWEDTTPIKTKFECNHISGIETEITIPPFAGSMYSDSSRKYVLELHTLVAPLVVMRDDVIIPKLTSKSEFDSSQEGWYYNSANQNICYIKPNGNAGKGFMTKIIYDKDLSCKLQRNSKK